MPNEGMYLSDIPLDQAWRRLIQALEAEGLWRPLESEEVAVEDGLGRVTAEPMWARRSVPHYHAAAMDGYALRGRATDRASERTPVDLLLGREAGYVDTGDALPAWADAVVPIEAVEALDRTPGKAIRLRAPVAPWSHVRPLGEDLVATELVVPSGHRLRPADLGALAAAGYSKIQVWRRPRVAIIPSGSELVPPDRALEPGQIPEFNTITLAAQVGAWGGEARRFPIVPDDLAAIGAAVASAAEADLVLLNAGSSAGSEDYTARVIQSLGEVLVHGIAVRPGHPVVIGMISRPSAGHHRTPIIGVPGYPVSAALTGEILVEPLLRRWTGLPPDEPETIEAVLTRKVHSSAGDLEMLRVTVGRVGQRVVAAPLARGAGVISSLVRADGLVFIPPGVQGVEAGETVTVRLYRTAGEIDRTLVALGSHDLTLDLMAQFLSRRGLRLASGHLGSQGGLVALGRGEAHFSGSHLLDPETGEFNISYVRRYLPGVPVKVIALVGREQGLITAAGNPRKIEGLEQLAGGALAYVNRQRGSGTRLLLDYHLARLGIAAATIDGYDREEYTHLGVAAAVASGRADCGLGIRAAAAALDLGFIPLFQERYDLVIPLAYYVSERLAPLLDLLKDPEFRQAVASLPGYDTTPMGELIWSTP
ncbi:MAG TPA: molybdopterin biosynthesis protein [Anaerolineales bacterium]|nr:molybdopterin biosynthesis protein [Anaerolineales bacterium]